MGTPSTTDFLIRAATREPLSEVLPTVLSAARRIDDEDLIRWVRLESSGYYPDNPGAEDDSRIPDYRKVRGRYLDARKNTINFPSKVPDIVNEQVLPQPVGTIESFAEDDDPIFIQDPAKDRLVRKHLGVNPAAFYFPAEAAADVVHAIRNRLVDKLEDRREELDEIHLPQTAPDNDEEPRGILPFVAGSVWQVTLAVLASVIAGFLLWFFGWI